MGGGDHAEQAGLVKVVEVNMFHSTWYREVSLLLQSAVSGAVCAEALLSGVRHAYLVHDVVILRTQK